MTDIINQNIENPNKAEVWLNRNNPHRTSTGWLPNFQDVTKNQFNHTQGLFKEYKRQNRYKTEGAELLFEVAASHQQYKYETILQNVTTLQEEAKKISDSLSKVKTPNNLWQQWLSYTTDSARRYFETADVLKERGDIFIEHERAGCPPVLDYDYDIVLDASTFDRPSNYVLLKIKPPEGIKIDDNNRPYIIIDPRAGHGAGIGGFKPESQVGVAHKNGHPVYFVAFKRLPEPKQTIADVTHAEAIFVREVEKRHPKAEAPVIVGNCQGGWAALILAATNRDISGPIIMNGAPVAAWSGHIGVNPMRYKAGVNGGTWLSMMSADLNNGLFDGAWLVNNFEQMNPYRNYIGKYYDLYNNPQQNRQRFLDFERWWGGFFLMNEAEIRWIVENIFIGNRLSRNTGQLEKGVNIDIRNVSAPIIVFASHGDDITPPPQALSWILDAYTDEKEVEICGQRIVYMIHEQVGHLGIFVSSSIANREHEGIASLMDTIEVLPPGLYEMIIENVEGKGNNKTFSVDLERRTFEDLNAALGECRTDEKLFKAVHRASKAQTRLYEQGLRPFIKAMSNETSAQIIRSMHPLRLERGLWSSKNPLSVASSNVSKIISSVTPTHETINSATSNKNSRADSKITVGKPKGNVNSSFVDYGYVKLPAIEPISQDNLFLQLEKMFMDSLSMTLDFWGDLQGMMTESLFYGIWAMPWMREYGKPEKSRRLKDKSALRGLPKVEDVLQTISEGGYAEAVIRMLILSNIVADNNIDRNQLTRLTEVLSSDKSFDNVSTSDLSEIIENQTLIVRFAEDESIESLNFILDSKSKSIKAFKLVLYVIGDDEHNLNQKTKDMLHRIQMVLHLTDAEIKL